MKYSEFHRKVIRQGWELQRQTGSHKIYTKNGKLVVIPDHSSKEIPKGLQLKLEKEMGL